MSRTSQTAVGPQVVIGLTLPSSAPPSDVSIPASGDLPPGASLRADGVPKLEIIPEAFESNHAIPLVPGASKDEPNDEPKDELDVAAPVAQPTEREVDAVAPQTDPAPLSDGREDADEEPPITRRMSDEMVAAAVQEPASEEAPSEPAAAKPANDELPAATSASEEAASAPVAANVADEEAPASSPAEAAAESPAASASSDSESADADVAASVPASDAPVVVAATSSREESGVDEISIPPVGDLDVDPDPTEPMADRFFAQTSHHASDELEWDEGEAGKKAARKRAPEVVERRERFSRYVKWAVAGAAVVCLAAVGRTAMTPASSARAPDRAPVVAAVAPAVEKAAPPAVETAAPAIAPETAVNAAPAPTNAPADTAKAETPPTTEAPSTPPAPATAEVAQAAAPVASAPASTDAPSTEPAKSNEVSPASAAEEKSAARKALERSKLADAIAHGERAVELDPTDGESWLILGAAYQEKGNLADARRCYTACAKEGKRGPIGECRAMLR